MSWANNSRNLRNINAKFSGYCFYISTKIQRFPNLHECTFNGLKLKHFLILKRGELALFSFIEKSLLIKTCINFPTHAFNTFKFVLFIFIDYHFSFFILREITFAFEKLTRCFAELLRHNRLVSSQYTWWDLITPCIKNSEYESEAKKINSNCNFYNFSLLVPSLTNSGSLHLYPCILFNP